MTLSGCASSKTLFGKRSTSVAHVEVSAKHSCPWLPADIRREATKITDIPVEDLTKAEVLALFRKYATSEIRKNYTIERVADLYDKCIETLKD
jgi:hypothetical protein